MEFAEKIKCLLASEGVTQKQFAQDIDMNVTHVNKFFTGRKPNMDFLSKIVQRFPTVDLNWLLFGEALEQPLQGVKETTHPYGPQLLDYIENIEYNLTKIRKELSRK